ncbi:hypothetical protein B0H11DRAFT_1987888 [Mycena galericulata]|nr:hypothetical protein B0H11DRAFT_1987888 [Mycena galericulata]
MNVSETVTRVVSLLGGPAINPEDIQWSLDIPAGQRLLDWLVSQLQPELDDTGPFEPLEAALQAISLEDAELQMLRHATRKTAMPIPLTTPGDLDVPVGYTPPWRLRAKEQNIGAEAALLETETDILKSRLQQSKIASQSLSKAIKLIESGIEKANKDIVATEDRLSELSINADVAVSASVNSSVRVLDELITDITSDQDESPHAKLLSTAASINATISDRFYSRMRAIDGAASRLPTASEMQSECSRLDAALNSPRAGGKSRVAMALDAAFDLELARLCQELEDPETGSTALEAVLASDIERSTLPPVIDVKAELEDAWALDQVALLEARGAVLDEALTAFTETLLPPLTALHEELAATDARTREAQALVSALLEEIQDIVADVHTAQEPRGTADSSSTAAKAKDADLEAGLTSLLTELKDLRPADAPPLILLTQEDILEELRSVYQRAEVSRRQDEACTAELLPKLRALEAAHAPLLDAAYAHSPMKSSPPFAFPPDLQAVQADAKLKSEDLGSAIAKLQEEVKTLESDRAKRRLEHFVAKWAK